MENESFAYQLGYWVGPLLLAAGALALVVWGVRSLRRTDRGAVRVIAGALVLILVGFGYSVALVDAVTGELPTYASAADEPEDDETDEETDAPTAEPSPSPKPTKKFKPKRIPDPGPARVYGDCNDAIDAYNAARFELIQRAKIAWVDGALSALLSAMRIVVTNTRCFEGDMVEGARQVTFKRLNEVPPQISAIAPECRQVVTNAFRLVGLANGMAVASDGDVNLAASVDLLRKRDPDCISAKDVRDMKKVIAENLPAAS